jgi:NAD(P)-dependent dehydrogenase (short-subunit alcohol dehydrogenase family)
MMDRRLRPPPHGSMLDATLHLSECRSGKWKTKTMTLRANYPSLSGRTVLVTGGASGIGAAIVRGFARQGARIAFLDLDDVAGEALVAELGDNVLFLHCDLTDVDALRGAVAEVEARFGPIRALVNNAANDQRFEIDEITPEQWDASQSVNIRQQFFVAQAVRAGMRDAGGGAIVNMSSTAWMNGVGTMVPYTAAKAGVVGLTRSLGAGLGVDNIRVNAIAPGGVMTERQLRLWHTPESKERMVQIQAIHQDLLEEDIADAVLFLSADDSRMITKQCLRVDGGLR